MSGMKFNIYKYRCSFCKLEFLRHIMEYVIAKRFTECIKCGKKAKLIEGENENSSIRIK